MWFNNTNEMSEMTQVKWRYFFLGIGASAIVCLAFAIGFAAGDAESDNDLPPSMRDMLESARGEDIRRGFDAGGGAHHEDSPHSEESMYGKNRNYEQYGPAFGNEKGFHEKDEGEAHHPKNEGWFHGAHEADSKKRLLSKIEAADPKVAECIEKAHYAFPFLKSQADMHDLFGVDAKDMIHKLLEGYNLEGIAYENGRPRDFILGELKNRALDHLDEGDITQSRIEALRGFLEEVISCK